MESNKIMQQLYAAPLWQVLTHLAAHPDAPAQGARFTKQLPHISQSAVYQALSTLKKLKIVMRDSTDDVYILNRELPWLNYMMLSMNLVRLQPLIDRMAPLAYKIILFGSRATAQYTATSDYDLCVISPTTDAIQKILQKNSLRNNVQLLVKTPEEWIDLHKTDPELYESIQQGIVVWDRK